MLKLILPAILVLGACAGPVDREPVLHEPTDYDDFMVSLEDARMQGDIGPTRDVDISSTVSLVFDDGEYVSIQMAAQMDPSHAVMMFVSSSNRDVFLPGNVSFSDSMDYNTQDVGLLACVGQAIDVYDIYDAAANEVLVVTDFGEVEGTVDVTVVGTWVHNEEARSATATFTIRR